MTPVPLYDASKPTALPSSAWLCAGSHQVPTPFPQPLYFGKTQKGQVAFHCSAVFHCHQYSSRKQDGSSLQPAAPHLPRQSWSGDSNVCLVASHNPVILTPGNVESNEGTRKIHGGIVLLWTSTR
ncbi:unnamed protein product [Staurois parvus]|uniref:Uncharacterized protein n=1 Tax=Staurois parvus TaxID=386267 RepID=A0ABN9CBE1_9NEOB|nr:unnamed protein product [Staurois parvus]